MKNLSEVLKFYLLFGSVYLLIDGLIHFFPVRLKDIVLIWPQDAYQYARFFNQLYGSLAIFISGILFIVSLDLKKYGQSSTTHKKIIEFAGIFAIFHGLVLIYNVFTFNFDEIFKTSPSLTFWIPVYNLFELFQAILLIGFAILVYFWRKSHD